MLASVFIFQTYSHTSYEGSADKLLSYRFRFIFTDKLGQMVVRFIYSPAIVSTLSYDP